MGRQFKDNSPSPKRKESTKEQMIETSPKYDFPLPLGVTPKLNLPGDGII